jgi:hypothetical protein
MVCDTTTPGPVIKVGLFAADSCFNPTVGVDAGYIDDCAMVASVTPETEDTRAEFLKTCPSGDIRAYVPARTVTKTTEVVLNFPWLPIEFLATSGAVEPVVFNGETVGFGDCDNAVNLIAYVWQELLGGDACGSGAEEGPSTIVTIYPLRDVRISQDGEPGTSDFNYQVIGRTQRANIGSGAWPVFFDEADADEPAWPDTCLDVCVKGVTFKGGPAPEDCGLVEVEEPLTPCTPGS